MSTGAPSHSALGALNWMQDDYVDDEERTFWRYLGSSAECYPQQYIPPLRKPMGRPRVHQQIGAKLDTRNGPDGQPILTRLWLFDGSDDGSNAVIPCEDAGGTFAREVLTTRYRSRFIVFREGGRKELRLIATQLGARLLELGFTIDVLMGGSRLKALIIKRGRHRWYLCCWESLSGRPARELERYLSLSSSRIIRTVNPAATVYRAVNGIQSWLMNTFGVGLSLTISNTALRAAARLLSAQVCKFKPLPLMVSLCRNGAGFRGGLLRGSRYHGPTWLIDLNRAYTAALEKPLPWHYVFDKCEKDGKERDGIYVCEVSTTRRVSPVYVGKWTGKEVETGWWTVTPSEKLWCVLTYREMLGMRNLDLTVRPRWGFVYTRSLSFAGFVSCIRQALLRHGNNSPIGKLTKLIGNSVYGKFSAPPERRDLRIAQDKPGRGWNVFVDEHGWPVADLWERMRTIYQWSQHVDMAAEITGRVREVMYETQATIEASGGAVLGMQTDCIVLDRNPADVLELDEERIGSWRVAGADADGYVVGANCWSVGAKNVIPDNPHPVRDDVIALYRDYPIEIRATKNGALVMGAPFSIAVVRRITPPSRAAPSVAAD